MIITLDEMKNYLRVDHEDDDILLESLIASSLCSYKYATAYMTATLEHGCFSNNSLSEIRATSMHNCSEDIIRLFINLSSS